MAGRFLLKSNFGVLILTSLAILLATAIISSILAQPNADDIQVQEDVQIDMQIYSSKVEQEVLDQIRDNGSAMVIVELDGGNLDFSSLERLREIVEENQDAVLSTLSAEDFDIEVRYKVISGFSGKVTYSGLKKLAENILVKKIYGGKFFYPLLEESVPLINATRVWTLKDFQNRIITGKGQTICVIDSGVNYTHPDLGGCFGQGCKVIGGWDAHGNDPDPINDVNCGDHETDCGHGTHVAGIVAANGGIKGVAPDANIAAVKACGFIFGLWTCPNWDMLEGVDWCINNKDNYNISVLTMSLGHPGEYNSTNCPTWMDQAINNAYNLSLPFTIAAGNGGRKSGIADPACSPKAISVGATYDEARGPSTYCLERDVFGDCMRSCTDNTTRADKVTCYSNSGTELDLMAPGSLIHSIWFDGDYNWMHGTSQATPHVAGTIALMKQYKQNLTVDQIVFRLKSTGVPVVDEGNGLIFSRVDALAAICTVPTNGMAITENTILCAGTYNLLDGISIGVPNIILDCNGATIIGNGANYGVYNNQHNNVHIKSCNIKNYGTGIAVYSSSENFIDSNVLDNNTYYGADVAFSANYNTLRDNIISNNDIHGIKLYQASHNILQNNLVENNNGYGFDVASSSNENSFTNNTANSNLVGIKIYDSTINNAQNNTLFDNTFGILNENSNYNSFRGNIVTKNQYGIDLGASANNIITRNRLVNNSYGMWMWSSNLNTVYNNIFNNTINAHDDGANSWNISKTLGKNIIGGKYLGGNSWHDYAGKDSTRDGLGDTMLPYNSTGNIANGGDFLPLVVKTGLLGFGVNVSNMSVNMTIIKFKDNTWPMFKHDAQHTGRSPYIGAQSSVLKWRYKMDTWTSSSPAIDPDGTIYTASSNTSGDNDVVYLNAINPNGTIKWGYFLGESFAYQATDPAIGNDGTIYITASNNFDTSVFAINRNGTVKWNFSGYSNARASSATIDYNDTIYVGYRGSLKAFRNDGNVKWSYLTNNYLVGSPAIGNDGTIYASVQDQNLHAVNPNGTLRWKYPIGYGSSPAIGSDGVIYVGSENGYLYSLNSNGSLKWSSLCDGERMSSPSISLDGTLYALSGHAFGGGDGSFCSFYPNGTLKWRYPVSDSTSSPSIGRDGLVYFTSFYGGVYSLNPDGSLKWYYNTNEDYTYSSPAIGNDGTIYVGSGDGYLYAFNDH
ncbi:MAG TPA: S8 family serine peptidase [Nanoarchaeota archaeon]|nr:MAG: WD40-like protein repeat protein [archaeon GW2011_AR6]HIH17511.1 S8 family serine peptidase [Nanoarchaeota archaeon]HIH33697.1 S8 family serine peptidase [Nanoarchaeota archaeon]HIH51485.1 S8 family serine peptidase [Nanoarchaeota archaeon]